MLDEARRTGGTKRYWAVDDAVDRAVRPMAVATPTVRELHHH